MSADKRQKILIGFAGLAVVLVAAIAVLRPSFKSEDASGAIGAVQKHRAPQIAQQDVVLGDEKTKQEQQVLYSDFLADATALQNASADFATASRSAAARLNLEATDRNLEMRSIDLQARFVGAARDQSAAMKLMMKDDALGMKKIEALQSEIDAVANRKMDNKDWAGLNARLSDAANAVETKQLNVRSLNAISADVAALGARLSSKDALQGAQDKLAAASIDMKANPQLGAMIRARADYFQAISKEARAMNSAREAFAGVRADVAGNGPRLAAISAALGSEAEGLQHRALENMKGSMASHADAAAALGRMAVTLDAINREVANHKATYEARQVENFNRVLNSFSGDIQKQRENVQAQAMVDMRDQLNGIKATLANAKNLDARSANRANVDAFAAQLKNLSDAAGNRAVYASALADSDGLGSQARSLMKEAADLQSRKQ